MGFSSKLLRGRGGILLERDRFVRDPAQRSRQRELPLAHDAAYRFRVRDEQSDRYKSDAVPSSRHGAGNARQAHGTTEDDVEVLKQRGERSFNLNRSLWSRLSPAKQC